MVVALSHAWFREHPLARSRFVPAFFACLALQACGGGGSGGSGDSGGGPPTNRPPVLAPIGACSLQEGATLTIDVSAADPDGDQLTYDSGSYPAFVTFTSLSGGRAELRVAPDFEDSGSYPLTVRVRDTAGNVDDQTFTLTVNDDPGVPNRSPVLAGIGNQSMDEGQVRTVAISAIDPDNDGLTLSATGLPAFATLTDSDGGSGSVRLTPGFSDSGNYTVTVQAADDGTPSLTDTETITITVRNTNRAPVITPIANQQVAEGDVLTRPISATDADGDGLTLSLTGPSFASRTDNGNGTGSLRLAPSLTDSGVYSITIRATDNGNPSSFSEDTLAVTVLDVTTNQVAIENRLPGTADWRLTNPAETRQIEGYASATSVNRGATISLFVNTAAPTFQLEVFRMGWYQGLGARRVFPPVMVNGTVQSVPSPNGTTGLVDANWINPYVLDTETNGEPWRTGVYLARLTESSGGEQSYIIFVVRDDSHRPDILFGLPVTTYQAYNPWGGKSIYSFNSGSVQPWGSTTGTPARKVSFNRPYAASFNPAAWYGMGAGEFLTNVQPVSPHPSNYPITSAAWDYNMVRWLENEQYDVGYITNIDVHRSPASVANTEVFLSPGHNEYWTWEMRDSVEDARDAGVNLAFLSSNTSYRQIRLEQSAFPAGSPEQQQRIMVAYKGAPDPILSDGNPGNDYLATVEFRISPPNRPEQNMIGLQYILDPFDGDIIVTNASHSVFARTGLTNGAVLPGLLGYEVDGRVGAPPANFVTLASTPVVSMLDSSKTGTSHMTLYTAGSGAEVFATGSMQWSWGLDDFNGPGLGGLRTARLSAAAQQITDNVLERFGATPYVPDPVAAECVQLKALSNVNGNPSWASAAEIDLLSPDGKELSKTQWSIEADSQETAGANNAATSAIDGVVSTFWHSAYSQGQPPALPHMLTINLGGTLDVSALRYLPRQDANLNGVIGRYEVYTSPSCASLTWTRVASGNWLDTPTANQGRKTARFAR